MYPKDLPLGKIQGPLSYPGGFLTPLPTEGTARMTGTSLVTTRQFESEGLTESGLLCHQPQAQI